MHATWGGPDRGVTLALFIIYYVFVWPSSGRIGKEQRSPVPAPPGHRRRLISTMGARLRAGDPKP